MFKLFLHLANLVSLLTPQTKCFRIRRTLYKVARVRVDIDTKIVAKTSIYHSNVTIGRSWIGCGSQFFSTGQSSIVIGNGCDIGPGVMFVTGSHLMGSAERRAGNGVAHPISIGDGTWVGARSLILGGADIGPGCVVAAGSTVLAGMYTRDSLLAGSPARIVRMLS